MSKIAPWESSCLCDDCAAINVQYGIMDGMKICDECGGMVLTLQEAADRIMELKSQLRQYEEEI